MRHIKELDSFDISIVNRSSKRQFIDQHMIFLSLYHQNRLDMADRKAESSQQNYSCRFLNPVIFTCCLVKSNTHKKTALTLGGLCVDSVLNYQDCE